MTESIYGFMVSGIFPLSMVKHLSFLIIRSTCTLTLAIRRVAVDAPALMLPFLMSGGANNLVSCKANRSWMLNPLSAITTSSGSS